MAADGIPRPYATDQPRNSVCTKSPRSNAWARRVRTTTAFLLLLLLLLLLLSMRRLDGDTTLVVSSGSDYTHGLMVSRGKAANQKERPATPPATIFVEIVESRLSV